MAFLARATGLAFGAVMALGISTGGAWAVQCGNNAGGFEAWRTQFIKENGVSGRALDALQGTRYATKTISADRNQKSFKLSLDEFMRVRGGKQIASQGKRLKQQHASLLASIEQRYGVTPGPLLAIWGMETGFGNFLGNQNIISAVATLAYDCRRSEFFTTQLRAALKLIDNGSLSPNAIGAAHGEIGQTQFLPANVLKYGVDGDGNGRIDMINSKADALASTANFLRGHGYRPGPASANRGAIAGWNAASVYQQAIIIIADEIDGN